MRIVAIMGNYESFIRVDTPYMVIEAGDVKFLRYTIACMEIPRFKSTLSFRKKSLLPISAQGD